MYGVLVVQSTKANKVGNSHICNCRFHKWGCLWPYPLLLVNNYKKCDAPRAYIIGGIVLELISKVQNIGICGGQSGAGAGFLRVLRFPLPIFIPPNNSPSSQSPGQAQ
jgi:hypothetical protein